MKHFKLVAILIPLFVIGPFPVNAQFQQDNFKSDQTDGMYRLPFYGNALVLSDRKDKGIDFQIDCGSENAEVLASRDGIVSMINNKRNHEEGLFVEVSHEDGAISRYTRLKQISNTLKTGDKVIAGDLLGYQGNTGTGNSKIYLHFEISTYVTDSIHGINWADKKAVFPLGKNYNQLGNDVYLLKYLQSNNCIDIPRGSDQNGIELKLWEVNYGGNQQWVLKKEGDYYQIISKFNGKAISITKDKSTGQYLIIQLDNVKSDVQLWNIKKQGPAYSITTKLNGYALNALSDNGLTLIHLKDGNKGFWNIQGMNEDIKAFLSPAEMKADVDAYLNMLAQNHPNRYAYTPKETFDNRVDQLKESLNDSLLYRDFFGKIIQLNNLVDGHTQIYREGSNSRHLSIYYSHKGLFFPHLVKIENGKIYLKQSNEKNTDLQEIESINTIPSKEILRVFNNAMNYESDEMNNWALQQSFQLYLYSFMNIQGPWYEMETKDSRTNQLCITLEKGRPIDEFVVNYHPYYDRNEKFKFVTYEKDSIALIEYNMCPMDPMSVKELDLFMKNSFSEIIRSGIKHVFVDITRNGGGGGDEVNKLLYNKLNHKAYNWTSIMYKKKPGVLKPDSITVPQCTDNITDGYANNVYLIQSRCTYSAAVGISAWFKFSGRAKIIGDETGGTTAAYVYAPEYFLPNSRIEYQVSNTLWTFPFGARTDQGILPDIPVKIVFEKHHFELADLKAFLSKI